jgi:hypothetical protein
LVGYGVGVAGLDSDNRLWHALAEPEDKNVVVRQPTIFAAGADTKARCRGGFFTYTDRSSSPLSLFAL